MTSSEWHVVAAWNWKNYIHFVSNFHPALQFVHTISDTERITNTLRITDDHISTSIYYKDTETHTYLHHQSSHTSYCTKGLPRSQLLRLHSLFSEDSDFLEKGGEMVSFFEQREYSPALLQNDLQAIRRFDWTDLLNNHNPSNQRSERIPLVLTYHPLNERIKRILLRNFNILSSDPETRAVFPQPPLVAYRRDSNLRDILVHTSDKSQSSFQAGTSPCLNARCRTCHYISSDTSVRGPQYSFVIKKAFSCQTSGLVYCISCRRCPAVYIGETGRTLRQRFGEHLRSIKKNLPGFPVVEHFNSAGHSMDDAFVRGMMLCKDNAQRKRLEMRLIFQLGTSQRRGLNSDFRFL